MTFSESVIPGARLTLNLNWKTIVLVLTVLGAGTGVSLGAVRCATTNDVAAAEKRVEIKINKEKEERGVDLVKFDARLVIQEEANTQLKEQVEDVQTVQHWQVADQAAERVSKRAPKSQREEARMRLFKWNMARLKLKTKKMPCTNLDCSN